MAYIVNWISKNIGRYCIKKQIGFGSTSKIFLAQDEKNKHYSIKMYYNNNYKCQFQNEVNILNSIDGEHFPKVIDTLQYKDYNCIVFPYYNNKDVFDTIVPQLPITDDVIMENMSKMTKPIYDLHQYNISHLDIKMENYLINKENNNFVLIDYGSSCNMDTFIPTLMSRGTKQYLPLEVLNNRPVLKSDVWSLGCIAIILHLNQKIEINNYQVDTQQYLDKVSDQNYHIKYFLRDTLVVDHKKRLSIEELYQKYFL